MRPKDRMTADDLQHLRRRSSSIVVVVVHATQVAEPTTKGLTGKIRLGFERRKREVYGRMLSAAANQKLFLDHIPSDEVPGVSGSVKTE